MPDAQVFVQLVATACNVEFDCSCLAHLLRNPRTYTMMYGHGPVMQAGPYEGYTMEDVIEQDPYAVLEYMDKYGYYDPEMRARATAALEARDEDGYIDALLDADFTHGDYDE